MSKNLRLLGAYAFAAFVDLLGDITGDIRLVYVSKPLLMPLLALWFFNETRGHGGRLRTAVLVALAFSTLGDILLMLNGHVEGFPFFLAGLGAFLVAQISYSTGFQSVRGLFGGYFKQKPLFIPAYAAYPIVLLAVLWTGIPADMRAPVAVYGAMLCLMAASVFNLKGAIAQDAFSMLFYGSLLFVLSDSMIALNKFGFAFNDAHIGIMLTYIVGQWLLASGAAVVVKEQES